MIRTKRKDISSGSEITEEFRHTPKKVKQLKLIIRERSIYSVLDELEKAGDISTALTLLFEISSFFPLKSKDAELAFQRLIQNLRLIPPGGRSSSSAADESAWLDVKLKMIGVLRDIAKDGWLTSHVSGSITPSAAADSPDGLMNLLLDLIADEDEPECNSALLTLVCDFQHYLSCESPAFKRMLLVCRQSLTDTLWSVRAAAFRLLTRSVLRQRQLRRENLLQPAESTGVTVDDLENVLCMSIEDSEGRVRSAAAECLLKVFQSGWAMPREHYDLVCRLSKDPAEAVRLMGLRLIHIYATTPAYVDTLVTSGANKSVEIRLVDHAFSTLCNSMHDLSATVRTEAAKLLGTLRSVSEKFLEQTLDKKLMSRMQFMRSSSGHRFGHQQQAGLSEWSTGRKFGEDAPMEKAEEESESLIPSGACGAFVTGLEDEHLSVRNASVEAISILAADCPTFAQNALDFLADMFNDEIEEVRLNAIKSLRRLCSHIVLKVDQMEVILNALDDASPDSREALRELLCICLMTDVPCLGMTVDALLNNLRRYQADRQSVWHCMKCVAANHAALAAPLVSDLLDLHPFFETTEPALEDPLYIAKLVFVLNVAAKYPPIKALFADHTWRHYHYLRSSSAHLVPNLDVVTENSSVVLDKGAECESANGTLSRCRHVLSSVHPWKGPSKWEVTKLVIEDLKRLADSISNTLEESEEDSSTSSSLTNARWRAQCLQYCAESVTKLEKLLHRLSSDEQVIVDRDASTSSIVSPLLNEFKEILKNSFALEHLWQTSGSNIDKFGVTKLACSLRLRTTAALMAINAPDSGQLGNRRWLSLFLSSMESLTKLCRNEPWIGELALLTEELSDDNAASKSGEILRVLASVPLNAALEGDEKQFARCVLRRKRAVILEPDKDNDTIVRFVSGLVACIKLRANIYDMTDDEMDNVRVRVLYPDQREQFIQPRVQHYSRVSPSLCRLRTDVLVTDFCWSDSARIELSLVYRLPTDTIRSGPQYDNETDPLSWLNLDTEGVTVKLYPKSRC